jgi:prepilin-type N-terminal cleavage/methylation domain-containing protein
VTRLRTASRGSRGYSLIELVWVVALIATISVIAVPPLLAGIDESRAQAAARYMRGRLYETRMQAVSLSRNVALRFVQTPAGYTFTTYVDENRSGVLTKDIQAGIDRPLGVAERLTNHFRGVDFAVKPGVPPVDSGSPPPGGDPIKLGTSSILTFSALGTSSSGTLYIAGRKGSQFALRIFGATGKIRLLQFDEREGQWKQR